MSETANQKKRKPRAPKSTAGADKEPVEKSAETQPTQTEQDALKVEASTETVDSSSEKPEQVESDKPEQDAEMAESQPKEGSDEDVQMDSTQANDGADGELDPALGILGAFKVRSKSDQGFWRSGVQFLRTKETVVLVVDEEPKDQPQILAQEDIEPELVLFMSKEKAKRVYDEPNLVVEDVELSDVIDISSMK